MPQHIIADDQTNINCDQAYEFGKVSSGPDASSTVLLPYLTPLSQALHRRNISLDNFILDEVVSREYGSSIDQ